METRTCRYCDETYSIKDFEIANIIKGKTYRRWRCRKCYLASKTKYKKSKTEWLTSFKKKLCCKQCGNNDFRVLDFHHRKQDEKEIDISNAVYRWSTKRLMKEINKCDVLCSNCHRILHWEEKNGV